MKKDNIMNIATSKSHYDMATSQAIVAATLMASLKEFCLESFERYRDTDGLEFGSVYETLVAWANYAAEDLIRASGDSIAWIKEDVEAKAND